jgi:ACS family tartrate transporter-like MFS transporter
MNDISPGRQRAEAALVAKIGRKLIPFLFFLYIIAFLDRVNVSFAKMEMTWFSPSVYGFGAGIFFLGYFLFEIPSNLILQRVGARLWIARIMFTWGLLAMGMAFAKTIPIFYGIRFLLGIAEAGFFPGVLLYLTYWFTAKERARMIALFMTANAVTYSFGGPISGWIMKAKPLPGFDGWQQMFLLEGLPAVLMTFAVLFYLPNGPKDAKWLSEDERQLLEERMSREPGRSVAHGSVADTFKIPGVWALCGTYFLMVSGMYGISLWIPDLIKKMGSFDPLTVGFLCAIPYSTAGFVMVANAARSDRSGERRLFIAIPALIGAAGLGVFSFVLNQPVPALIAVTVAAAGMWSILGPFWAWSSVVLAPRGAAALAAGIALVNSVGNIGGFAGPYVFGFITEKTSLGNQGGALYLATSVFLGALLVLVMGRSISNQKEVPNA